MASGSFWAELSLLIGMALSLFWGLSGASEGMVEGSECAVFSETGSVGSWGLGGLSACMTKTVAHPAGEIDRSKVRKLRLMPLKELVKSADFTAGRDRSKQVFQKGHQVSDAVSWVLYLSDPRERFFPFRKHSDPSIILLPAQRCRAVYSRRRLRVRWKAARLA